MGRRGIRFVLPDSVTEVEEREITALLSELERIANTVPPKPDVEELMEVLPPSVGYLNHVGTAKFPPDERQRAILLRATDHLQNAGHEGALLELRQRLIATHGVDRVTYNLTPLGQDFTSYSFDYAIGDRLVTIGGGEYRVAGVVAGDPDDTLVVEPWLVP